MSGEILSSRNILDLSFEKCLEKLNKTKTLYEREKGIQVYPFRIVVKGKEICLLERKCSDGRKCVAIMFHIGRDRWFNIIPTEEQSEILIRNFPKLYKEIDSDNSKRSLADFM